MNKLRIYKGADYNDMSRKAAAVIQAQLTVKPESVLGLATGSSPVGLYDVLAKMYKDGEVDFSCAKTVNLDEYLGLSPDNDQSYRYFMQKNLFSRVNIDIANTYVPNGLAADPDEECARYDDIIEKLGGVDLQLIGIGVNGHIGFNEPADSFPVKTHVEALAEKTINVNKRFFKSVDDVPRKAFTMGIGAIMSAPVVLLIASGKEKAQALKEAFFGPVTPHFPASVLQFHRNVILAADKEALSLFPDR
ncbi:MAG: glucosamine-6-phosphate deaminase [Spirochaetaceae bacterium]|jgi:glucosamine-6-phosphate deaminase|nr:glucosamine-6-phosphate deaminase [Spirochaetaceae bacterium]